MTISFFEKDHRMIPGCYVSMRSTLVKTERGLVLISPVEFTQKELHDIRSLGKVVAIVEPSTLHNMWAASAKSAFPSAELWTVPGFEERQKAIKPDKVLTKDPWPFEDELPAVLIDGVPALNEVVFFYRAAKTLIVTDLVFNLKNPKGVLAPVVYRLMGTYKKFAVSKLWKSRIQDPEALKSSLKKILAYDFAHLVMAHGSIVTTDAKRQLENALIERGLL